MSTTTNNELVAAPTGDGQVQLVTFEVGPALLALEISAVQEINRNLKLTHVPHAPSFVRGVTNLRGEVVTVLDLHIVLGMSLGEVSPSSRNLIVNHDDELFGLWVDRVSDIMSIQASESSPPPSNLQGVPRKLIRSVYRAPSRLVMILDLGELLNSCSANEVG